MKITTEQKAEIAKWAAENGIAETILHFVKKYPNLKDLQSSEAVFARSLKYTRYIIPL